jgi:hypothetical protein
MTSQISNSRRYAPITNSAVTGLPSGQARRFGDVPLQADQGSRLGLQFAVHGVGATGELDEPVPLHGLLGFGYLPIDPAQGAAGTVMAVLVVDDPGHAFRGGTDGLEPGEDVPVGDVLAGYSRHRLPDRDPEHPPVSYAC